MTTQRCGRTSRRTLRGFTLVELLVVLAVIGILAAMAFPVFAAARKSAQRASCMSNLRQIHVALSLYLQDSDGLYPEAVNPAEQAHPERWEAEDPAFAALIPWLPQFHEVLFPYTGSKQVFRCPSDFGLQYLEFIPGWGLEAPNSSFESFGTSYFYQTYLAEMRVRDARINFPSDTMVLMDADGKWHGSAGSLETGAFSHRYNILLADGHVRFVTHEELGRRYWYLRL